MPGNAGGHSQRRSGLPNALLSQQAHCHLGLALMHSHLAGPLVHEGTCTTTPRSHGWAAAGGLLREVEMLALVTEHFRAGPEAT